MIAATVGAPFSHLESLFVLHYAPGQVFEDHYDFVGPEIPDYAQEIARQVVQYARTDERLRLPPGGGVVTAGFTFSFVFRSGSLPAPESDSAVSYAPSMA